MAMTPDAKRLLSSTIRGLRARLLSDLEAEVERVYRFSIKQPQHAGLGEAAGIRRRRLEDWTDEQARAETRPKKGRKAADFRREAVQQAAYTLLNRLVVLRLLEAGGLRTPAVVTGGWQSRGYLDFREIAPAVVRDQSRDQARDDASEGYAFLLGLVFEELAVDLPGLFGAAGIAELVPVPAATLRHAIEQLDQAGLASCWTDDMTLGWVYQYWNDPEREALDAKLNAGGKVEPHEIASKTQMFTERYMVDWLLQNSLGPMWLATCRRHGWMAEVEAAIEGGGDGVTDGGSVLDRLEARRVDWRAKRDAGEVALTELMPLHDDVERRWAYYVPQPIPGDAVAHAPESVRDLRILDPAVGSGHFLVVAFELLVALYREEARHRGESDEERWTDAAIVERILEHNLHGIDLDPRAVQIAAAALWLKAQKLCPEAHPRHLGLVASSLRLASLPDDDPALVELRRDIEAETGIPAALTDTLVHALQGADHLGSLLRIDQAVEDAIRDHEGAPQRRLFDAPSPGPSVVAPEQARKTLLGRLETFLARHGTGDDLGLRLRGEQLAAGVRFVRMVEEGRYDLVVGNPPYQGTSKLAEGRYVKKHYPRGKADLYAAFLERGLQLVRPGGVSALLTMRNWMFIKQYADLRQWLLEDQTLRAIGDLSWGAFEQMRDNPVAISVFTRSCPSTAQSVAISPTDPQERVRTLEELDRKRAGILCHVGRHDFDPSALKVVPEWPLVYWWGGHEFGLYKDSQTISNTGGALQGISTADNSRFLRFVWEVRCSRVFESRVAVDESVVRTRWVPYIKGPAGRGWVEPLLFILSWWPCGLEVREARGSAWRNSRAHFCLGVSFPRVGSYFSARIHRYASVFDSEGPTLLSVETSPAVCMLNSAVAKHLLSGLNPTVHFMQGDIDRLPLIEVKGSRRILASLELAFSASERSRESSVEFRQPGPSPWRHAQEWAQTAVDRPEGAPLPPYEAVLDPEPPTDHLSFALGVALGRFGPVSEDGGEGILDPAKDTLDQALPAGICFLDGTLDPNDRRDSLGHAAAERLHDTWRKYGPAIDAKAELRTWLRLRFFPDVHKGMYENRPIHWPLSSAKKTFVAWITIHRWNAQTLRILLADHLGPALTRLDGELADLRATRDGGDPSAARTAEGRYDKVLRWQGELAELIASVEPCADLGPPPTDPRCPERAVDAPYDPDLDDGVMINAAALWPLLAPQWKDPAKWWKELATAKGRKDYDWSHLAMRYWPQRVDAKCQQDPSLGVAHGCFWRYHPERAWAWELRLQDEIGPDFRIEEAPYRPAGLAIDDDDGDAPHRAAWLRDHPGKALAAVEKEAIRRMGRGDGKKVVAEMRLLEPGIWSALPEAVAEMEVRLSERQDAAFRLRAADEDEGRRIVAEQRPDLLEKQSELQARADPATLSDDQAETSGA